MARLRWRHLSGWLLLSLSLAGHAAPPAEDPAVAELLASARLWNTKLRADLARNALEKALRIQPDNPQVLLALGMLELNGNAFKQAQEWLQKLQTAHPNDAATRQLADAYRIATTDRFRMGAVRTLLSRPNQQDREKAVAELRKLFPNGAPEGELGITYYSIIDSTAKGQAEAQAGLERLVKQMPGDPRPLMALAEHYFGSPATLPRGIRMAVDLVKREDVSRKDALALWRSGLSYLATDPDSIPFYKEFLAQDPNDEEVLKLLAQASDPQIMARKSAWQRYDAGDKTGAANTLENLAREHPEKPENIGNLGMLRLRQGRYQEAVELFQQAARMDAAGAKGWRDMITDAHVAQWIKQADDAMLAERVDEAQEKVREALRLRPNDPDAMATQAEIHAGRNNAAAAAEPLFRAVLKADPANYRAVKGLATLMSKAGQSREARRFVEDVIKANPSQADSLADVAAGVIRDESDRLLAENRPEAALSLLEESRRLYPKASWLRYDLARLYARRGDVEGGRRLMAQGGGDPTDAYAQALFLSGLDDEAAALEALSRIPEDKEDASTRTLARQLTIRLRGKQAQALFAKDKKAARQMLEDAEALAENNADLRWEAAAAWLRIGEAQRGLELGRQLLGKGPITAEQRLAYANLLDTAKRDSELTAWLEKIDDSAKLSAAQKLSLQGLHRSVLMRRVDTLRRQQRNDEARQLLEAAMKQQAQDARLLTAEGELLAESGDTQAASRLFSQAIEIQPDYHDARIAQTKIWWESGEKALALRELENLRQTVPAEDKDTRLSLARRYTSQEQYDEARGLLKDLGQRFPGDENTLLQMGYTERAAENYDSAMSLFAQAKAVETPVPAAEAGGEEAPRSSASEAMDDIQLRRYGYFSTGWDQRTRTGDPGISQISNTEVPMYIRFADGYRGHWFAHVDQSTVDAGRLPLYNYDTAALFGKLQAYGANNLQGKAHELATGTAFGAGYESDNWRVDLGSSPQGFPISYWVGGIKNTGSIGDLFWSADFSRRPVSTSLTSYAGARDPVTGAVWGGVKKTGPEVYVGYDWGPVTLFAQGVYHYLNGTNVKANQEVMVRTGAELALLTLPNMRLSAGVALMHWRFEENQRYYTYGHGGYYSPQDYKSVSLPVQGSGRVGKFSYQVRGAITWAASYEENADFYPTSDTLQALAATQVLPKGYTNPIYKGSYGASFGYSASAAVEYQATPQLYLGGHWQMQHSPYYTPNYLGFYFRYAWEPREEPVLFPPKRLKPYYDF